MAEEKKQDIALQSFSFKCRYTKDPKDLDGEWARGECNFECFLDLNYKKDSGKDRGQIVLIAVCGKVPYFKTWTDYDHDDLCNPWKDFSRNKTEKYPKTKMAFDRFESDIPYGNPLALGDGYGYDLELRYKGKFGDPIRLQKLDKDKIKNNESIQRIYNK
eukprot:412335_1